MQSRIIAGSEYRYATSSREKMNALMAQRMYIIETVTRHYANLRNLDNSLPEMPDIRALKLVELKQLDAEILIAHATKVRKRAEESKDPVQRKKAWWYHQTLLQNARIVGKCTEYTKNKSILSSLLVTC